MIMWRKTKTELDCAAIAPMKEYERGMQHNKDGRE